MLKRFSSSILAAALLFPQAASPLLAAEQATLDGVEVGPDQVTLHLSRQVKYNSFVTADPPRLVIELVGAEHMPAVKLQNGQGKYLRKVRSGQFQKEPSLIVRIVLDLAKLVGYQAKWKDRDLVVRLQGEAGKEPDLDAEAPEPEPAVKVPEPAPKPAAPAAEPLPKAAPAPRAVALESVEVGPDTVSLQLSEKVRFTPSVTANPPRLIVELAGVEHRAKAKLQEGQGRFLKKVRSGQFKKTPLTSRIVLDLAKPVGYQAKWEGSRLVLSLQGGAEPAAEAAVPAPKPAAKTIAVSVTPEAQPPVSVSTPAAAAVQVEAQDEEEAPEPEAPAKKAPPIPKEFSSELGEMAATPESSRSHEEAVARAYSGASYAGGRRDILASLSSEPITLDFDQTDIRDVLKLVAAKAKVNIIYGADVGGPISLHLVDVPFREAFMTILQMQGFVADQTAENILRIMTPATLAKERSVAVNQTRVIKLKYSKAGEMKTAVDAVRQAEGRQGKITVDDGSNSMIVTDTLEGIASLENLLSKLDVRPLQVMIEAKLVEVKLTKDLHFGIQWDYFDVNRGEALGKQGLTTVGSPAFPGTDPFTLPLDQNSMKVPGMTTTGGAIGAGGRGTGVFLPASKAFGALTVGRITNNYLLSATLTAAASQGKVKVLSDPKIATLNGKKASINITTQIPYVTSNVSATGVISQNTAFITTGIMLDVTPTINADGRITLEVNPTVSQPSGQSATGTGAPAVDSRTAKTMVISQDGETIVIGGLITDSVSNQVAKVPLLGDIPFLGWLFKKKFVDRSRVELLIFVTTRVMPS